MNEFGESPQPEEVQNEASQEQELPNQPEVKSGGENALLEDVFSKYGKEGVTVIFEAIDIKDPFDLIEVASKLSTEQLADITDMTRQYGLDAFNLEKVLELRETSSPDTSNMALGAEKIEELFKR